VNKFVGTPTDFDLMGFFLLLVSISFVAMPFFLAPFGLYFGFDPFYGIIQKNIGSLKRLGIIVYYVCEGARAYLTVLCLFGAFRLLFLVLVMFITLVRVTQNILMLLIKRLKSHGGKVDMKYNFVWYNQLVIGFHMAEFVEIVTFMLMAVGMIVLVILNFAIIKMYNFFPLYIFCMFPVINVIILGTIQLTVPRAVDVTNKSHEFIMLMKLNGGPSVKSYIFRRAKALIPATIDVGLPGYKLFSFENSTKINYYSAIFNHTINLITALQL